MRAFASTSSLLLLAATPVVHAFDYAVEGGDLSVALADVATGIAPIRTIFLDEPFDVSVEGLAWTFTNLTDGRESAILTWETFVDGVSVATGTEDLEPYLKELPGTLATGTATVTSRGRVTVTVDLTLDGTTVSASNEFEAFGAGVSFLPLLVVLLLAATTHLVEFALFAAIFVGSCMVAGNVTDGFKATLDDYILNAVASVDHAYVVLFTLFLSGLVGQLERSGGMEGFTKTVAKFAYDSRSGVLATFGIGVLIFFDDYANVLLAGESMRPLTDLLHISREKLAFVVDATAAPVASLTPVSSWVGFEVDLIQSEIDRLIDLVGEENLTIETSGLGVFLQTIKYRYYPIFMIFLIPLLVWFQRDFGPMLVAERKVQVYERTDGGDGGLAHANSSSGESKPNAPRPDQPPYAWNMLLPIAILIFLIIYSLIQTGTNDGEDQDFLDKLQASDSYSALLWSTMGAVLVTVLLYHVQIVQDGRLVLPTPGVLKGLWGKDADGPRFLLNFKDNLEGLLYGMGRIFPALIVLNLAWASGSVMTTVGVDRLFSAWIVGGLDPSALPTLSFVISAFMALATGTSWGTMAIVMPLIVVPTYTSSDGDATIVYATIAGILSGAVAGDHVSPISDTTVLTALACDCTLLGHVATQAPYAIMVSIVAILFGTLPIGKDAWPNIVGILLGAVAVGLFVFLLCKPIISANGSYDIVTELIMKATGVSDELAQLKVDTKAAFQGGAVEEPPKGKHLAVEEESPVKAVAERVDVDGDDDDEVVEA